jgi:O-antigen/teichoic acid export membrane protein
MSGYEVFIKRLGLVGATSLLVSLSGIILLPILTKSLTIEQYGKWVQIGVTAELIPTVVTLGLPYTMVRFLPANKGREDLRERFYTIFFAAMASSSVATLVMFAFSDAIAMAIFDGDASIGRLIPAIVFLECLNYLMFTLFRAVQQIKRYSIFVLFRLCLYMALVSYLVMAKGSVYAAAIGLLVTDLIAFLTMYAVAFEMIGLKIPSFYGLREYLSFSLPIIPWGLSTWFVNSSDRYIIGMLLGAAYVGYYSPGYTLGNMLVIFVTPFSFLLPAALSKQFDEGEHIEVRSMLNYSLKFFLMIGIPSSIGLSILSRPILEILSTDQIAAEGYLITPFIALSSLLFGANSIVMQVLVLEKRSRLTGAIWGIAAASKVMLTLALVPATGIVGAALATSVSYSIVLALTSYHAMKSKRFSFDPTSLIKSVLASLAMVPIIYFVSPQTPLKLVAAVVLSAATYFAALVLIGGLRRDEIEIIKNLARR